MPLKMEKLLKLIKDLTWYNKVEKSKEILRLLTSLFVEDAPQDGNQYARQDGEWTTVEAGGGGTTQQVTSKVVYCTLADVGAESPFQEDIDALVKDWVVAQGITKSDNEDYLFVLVDDLPSDYNLDIEATDWASGGITDKASFISFLEGQGATDVVVTNFSLVDGRLQCNLTFDGMSEILFESLGITKINNISNLSSILSSSFYGNDLTILENVVISENLEVVNFNNNNINSIDENLKLPINLTIIELLYNNFTTADYELVEAWATNQPAFTNPCVISFYGNPDSPIGTNFESILLTKNVILTY